MLDRLRPPAAGLILDMDGVLWKDSVPIGDLPRVFDGISSKGLKVALVTNNATLTVDDNLAKLKSFGVTLEPWQIITSSHGIVRALCDRFPVGTSVFVVGEAGVITALRAQGFQVIDDPNDRTPVQAVVGGFDRSLTYQKLNRGAAHIRSGAAYYGTNPDPTFPTPEGLAPGAGSILAALSAASGKSPTIIGKPAPFLFQLAAERMQLSKDQVLVVGDRLETDIDGGSNWGARTALVLSGVSSQEQLRGRQPQPDLVAANLTELVGA